MRERRVATGRGQRESYERYLASAFAPWARALVALAALKEGERVLDVACGTGIVARNAAPVTGASWHGRRARPESRTC